MKPESPGEPVSRALAPRPPVQPPAKAREERDHQAQEWAWHATEEAAAGRLGEAVVCMREALRCRPRWTEGWLQQSAWLRAMGNDSGASAILQRAIRKISAARKPQPITQRAVRLDLIALWLALAETQMDLREWDACVISCTELMQLDPNHHSGLEMLATALAQESRLPEATDVLRRLLQLSPLDPLHRLRLASLLQMQGLLGEALYQLELVVQLQGNGALAGEAIEAIESMDRMQTHQILARAVSDPIFRHQLESDCDQVLQENGFALSTPGLETLRHLVNNGNLNPEQDDDGPAMPAKIH